MSSTLKPVRAVVLLSGGIDSTVVAAQAIADGFEVHALTVAYGQRHLAEVAAATWVAGQLDVADHKIVTVDLRTFGGSALTDDIDVPDHDPAAAGIPATYVPARNTILLSLATAWAVTLGATVILVGANAEDQAGYPDCRPAFIEAFETMARLGTAVPLTIRAPLAAMTKAQVITLGTRLGVDYTATVSCYQADRAGRACGRCDACHVRLAGFDAADITDPTTYQ